MERAFPPRRTLTVRLGDRLVTLKPVSYMGPGGCVLRLPAGWKYLMDPLDPWIVWQEQGDGTVVIRPASEEERQALRAAEADEFP